MEEAHAHMYAFMRDRHDVKYITVAFSMISLVALAFTLAHKDTALGAL